MVEKFQLDNGVRIVLEKIPSVRSVAIGVWVGTGSRHEQPHNNGISHFIEHMFFKGTTKRSAREIAETFDRIGGQVNAFTSKEYTCYYAKVLDSHIDIAIDVLADMYFNSVFDPVEIEKEKKVVIEEIGMYEDAPDELVNDLILSSAYGNHPLGQSILGTESVLKQLTREQMLEYVDQNYTPEKTVISIAGNIDATIVSKISALFSNFKRAHQDVKSLKPTYVMEHALRTKKELEQSHICIALPGYQIGQPNIYSLVAINNILGGSMSSRLFQEIREERGLAYSVFSYHSSFTDSGITVIYAATNKDQMKEVIEQIAHIVHEIKRDGITETELNNCKEQLKGNLMLSLESTNSRMSRLGKNELMLGRHLTLDEITRMIDDVSMETVKQVSEEILGNFIGTALVSPVDTMPNISQLLREKK